MEALPLEEIALQVQRTVKHAQDIDGIVGLEEISDPVMPV